MIKLRTIVTELKQGKYLSVFDADDTLIKSDAWVYIKRPGKKELKLDAAEFAVYKLKDGEEYDFREFDRMIRNPRIIKKNVDLLKKQLDKARKHSGRQVTILTARAIGYPIKHFFKTLGMNVYVVAVGTGDPKAKADWIENKIKSGYTTVYFMDDSMKNVKAVQGLQKKYPDVKIKTVKV